MITKRKLIIGICSLVFSLFGLASAVYALVEETVKITGVGFQIASSFASTTPTPTPTTSPTPTPIIVVGNANLKLLKIPNAGTSSANIADAVVGPVYQNVDPSTEKYFPVKFYNQGQVNLNLVATADYVSDPDTLRDDLYVGVYDWNDLDSDGQYDVGESGTAYGYDTILRLRNDTFLLGSIAGGQTKGFVYKFSGSGLSSANLSMSAIYDFKIVGTEVN